MTRAPAAGLASLFGLPVGRWTTREFIDTLCAHATQRHSLLVTYLNAHNVNITETESDYADVLRRADILYADGMSIVWASKRLDPPRLPERVNAGDFFLEFCRTCGERNLSVYLLGSEPGVARKCAERITRQVPGLRIAGASDGFWGRGGEYPNEQAAVGAIRTAQPDILLLGLGVPLQERWADRHRAQLGVPVVWCVGALFEYYSGYRARAPRWVRRIGLEWLFRLALEPRRLAHRYLVGNVRFLRRVARESKARRHMQISK